MATRRRGRQSPEALLRTAAHEAGHAIVLRALGWPIEYATVKPGKYGRGHVSHQRCPTRRAPQQALVCLAGEIGEWLLLGSTESGSDPSGETIRFTTDMENALAILSTRYGNEGRVIAELGKAETRAARLLAKHRRAFFGVTAALLDSGTITGAEVRLIYTNSRGGGRRLPIMDWRQQAAARLMPLVAVASHMGKYD